MIPLSTHQKIMKAACEVSGFNSQELFFGKSRRRDVSLPRWAAWVAMTERGYSLSHIAQVTGHYDHTSIMHALRNMERWRDDPRFSDTLSACRAAVSGTGRAAA